MCYSFLKFYIIFFTNQGLRNFSVKLRVTDLKKLCSKQY